MNQPTMAQIFQANLTAANDCRACCGTGRIYPIGEGGPPRLCDAADCPAVERARKL